MLYEEQNIQWKHYINVLKLLKVYIQHKTIIRFGLIVFYLKVWMYLTCQQQQKIR